jgi:hypothetical protein
MQSQFTVDGASGEHIVDVRARVLKEGAGQGSFGEHIYFTKHRLVAEK